MRQLPLLLAHGLRGDEQDGAHLGIAELILVLEVRERCPAGKLRRQLRHGTSTYAWKPGGADAVGERSRASASARSKWRDSMRGLSAFAAAPPAAGALAPPAPRARSQSASARFAARR